MVVLGISLCPIISLVSGEVMGPFRSFLVQVVIADLSDNT